MTSTTTTKTFALYSKTTGHGFGEWQATSADDAMDQMEEQAGETLDRSDIECIERPAFSASAMEAIEETGANWVRDLIRLRTGKRTRETLLEECLDGADEDRVEGWQDYVSALVVAA